MASPASLSFHLKVSWKDFLTLLVLSHCPYQPFITQTTKSKFDHQHSQLSSWCNARLSFCRRRESLLSCRRDGRWFIWGEWRHRSCVSWEERWNIHGGLSFSSSSSSKVWFHPRRLLRTTLQFSWCVLSLQETYVPGQGHLHVQVRNQILITRRLFFFFSLSLRTMNYIC